jgi:hypothetical protein
MPCQSPISIKVRKIINKLKKRGYFFNPPNFLKVNNEIGVKKKLQNQFPRDMCQRLQNSAMEYEE